MNFCHACGAKQPGATSFCTSCGARLDREETPPGRPGTDYGSPAPQQVQAPNSLPQPGPVAPLAPAVAPVMTVGPPTQQGAWRPGPTPAPGTAGMPGPATGAAMPSLDQMWQRHGGDWSRALISILLLLLSLSMAWNNRGSSADNVPALLAIIVALPIGVVDLLLRPAIVGRVFDANQRLLFRALLAAPLVAMALWAVIDNFAHETGFGFGIGVALAGAAVGVTGAVTMSEPGQARMWLTAGAGSLVLSCLWLGWTMVQMVRAVKLIADLFGALGVPPERNLWVLGIATVLTPIWIVWLAAWVAKLAFSGSPKTRPIACWLAACLGGWLIVARMFDVAFKPADVFTAQYISAFTGAITLFAVGIALLTSSSIRKAVPQPPAFDWMTAAHTGLLVIGTAHLMTLVTIGLTLSERGIAKGPYIWLLVLQMAGAAGAFVTRAALGRDSKAGRIPVLIYAAAFTAAFWLTYLIADSVKVGGYSVDEAVLMVGPAAVAFCLLVPPSVRKMLGPIGVPAAFLGTQVPPGAPDGQFSGGPLASPGAPQAGGQG